MVNGELELCPGGPGGLWVGSGPGAGLKLDTEAGVLGKKSREMIS